MAAAGCREQSRALVASVASLTSHVGFAEMAATGIVLSFCMLRVRMLRYHGVYGKCLLRARSELRPHFVGERNPFCVLDRLVFAV